VVDSVGFGQELLIHLSTVINPKLSYPSTLLGL
jgi:hypothetical protein